MIIRNGIKSNIRAKGRTVLFFILIVLLAFSVVLSLCVRLYAGRLLEGCDEAYRSIALIEYMGAEYPDADEPDELARKAFDELDVNAAEAIEGVNYISLTDRESIHIDGNNTNNRNSRYAKYGVLVVGHISGLHHGGKYDENTWEWVEDDENGVPYYTAIVYDVLYADEFKVNTVINIYPGDTDFAPEPGSKYIIHGKGLERNSVAGVQNSIGNFEITAFINNEASPYVEKVTGEQVPAAFTEAAEHYEMINRYTSVEYAADLNDLYDFHQGNIRVQTGRIPSPSEEGYCVISPDIAGDLNITVGDKIEADLLLPEPDDRYDLSPSEERREYTVAGIIAASNDHINTIWAVGHGGSSPLYGYLLATASLENAVAEEASERLAEILPDNMRVSVFDQGYSSAAGPLRSIISTSTNILIVCAAGVLAIMLLFAFLFVGRQKYPVKIMVSLGTPKSKIALFLLSGAIMISLVASAIGTIAGRLFLPKLFDIISSRLDAGSTAILKYSETSVGITKSFSMQADIPLIHIIAAGAVIVLISIIFCLAFMRTAYREGSLKKGRSRVHIPHGKTSVKGSGAFRFARLSIRRGGIRSLAVPVVA
ncbi:MAG: FtsX-like permease family protein, partial [Lachnospiraceae bacterium]|nr:FtsX-like permease family protein [Lachnospiraceae bacterium]